MIALIVAAMAATYFLAKRGAQGTSSGAPLTVAPTSATPAIPENNAARPGTTVQQYFPSGFTSQTTGPTSASPSSANTNPSGLAVRSTGPSPMERAVYTEVSTPYTPVGAFTRKGYARPAASPTAHVSDPKGAAGAPAPRNQAPRTPVGSTPPQGGIKRSAQVKRARPR